MNSIDVGGIKVGPGHQPLVIAELSGNHNGSMDRALEIVEAAALAGAHALKLQTYTADTMTLDMDEGEFSISDDKSPWYGASLYDLYERAHTPWEWHEPIMKRCRELGMVAFSTPFDETSLNFLEELNVPCHKIASFENTDLPLIRKVAATGKPMIISTGMASVSELEETVVEAREAGCKDLILLKCTSSYPSGAENSNVSTIPNMRDLFGCQVGLSDHTLGNGAAIAAVALGATVIEKHFTLRRSDGGVDSVFSIEPDEMSSLVQESRNAWLALGQIHYGPTENEMSSLIFRRSLYIVANMNPGDILSAENLRAIRPGFGMAPKYLPIMMGKRVNRAVKRGTPLSWDLLG